MNGANQAERHLVHVVGPLERWDHLAWRYYGDASAYGPIVTANRDLFTDPLAALPPLLPFGVSLRIPLTDTSPRIRPGDLPPWLR